MSRKIIKAAAKVELILRKCKKDPAYFINNFVKIEDKDSPGIVIPFDMWQGQEKAIDQFENERLNIILKARQLGITWLVLAYAVYILLLNSGSTVAAISETENDSKELVRRIKFILRNLPNWIIREKKEAPEGYTGPTFTGSALKVVIHFVDGEDSTFKGFTSNPSAARSFTANLVILDEWAYHSRAKEIFTSAYPTINRPDGGKVIGLSTMKVNTFFEDLWDQSNWDFKAESGAGENNFKGLFLPWYADPRRDRNWYESTKKDIPKTYKTEYPATPAEAKTVGEGAAFDEWDSEIHAPYSKDWYPPSGWKIVRAYDGGYNRAACIWFAISPDGLVVAYREYYPSKVTDPEQAETIRAMSRDNEGVPEEISYTVADTSCWAKNQDTGESTAEIFAKRGVPLVQADKDRVIGWRRLHQYLHMFEDEEGNLISRLRFTANCSNTIRCFPGLEEHEHKPADLAPGQEDHLADVCRYFVMSRPNPKTSKNRKEKIKKRRERINKSRNKKTGY